MKPDQRIAGTKHSSVKVIESTGNFSQHVYEDPWLDCPWWSAMRGLRLWHETGKTEKAELIMSYIKRETVSLSLPCSLMHSQGSLLVSSHASITNAAPHPFSLTGGLFDFHHI